MTRSIYAQKNTVASPDGKISVLVYMNEEGKAIYSVRYANALVLTNSKLGIIREDADFSKGLKLGTESASEAVKESYTMVHGKRRTFSYHGNKKTFHLANGAGQKVDVIFQVSNDGVAFRYYFPDQSTDVKTVKAETSSFGFPGGTKGWLQPITRAKSGWNSVQPSYEENYFQNVALTGLSDTIPGIVYPALFQTGKHWVLISETGPDREYCATRLLHQPKSNELSVGFPDPREVFTGGGANPIAKLPFYTPWRVITIGNTLGAIVESTLGTDLAQPAIKGDFSYVKPGRASWSWPLLKDDSTIYSVQKKFIDYAANMKWEYCLIDAEWDKRIGNEKIAELSKYAQSKGVGILVWYNSAGDWNTVPFSPKDKLLTSESRNNTFAWLKEVGIKGVKIDFFGGDGQSMIAYYHDILSDAVKYGLMVNFHGCTLPRGWQRTYPHLVTMESVRGFENVTFSQEDADLQPTQAAMYPFTRNVFDPMDYTPVAFSEVSGKQRKTSNAFELALPFLFTSGIQHFAEIPEGMAKVPAYVKALMSEVPVSWEETHFVDGFPGKFIVLARKANNTWYISGINAEKVEKTLKLKLPFIKGTKGVLVTDGTSNRSFVQQNLTLNSTSEVTLKLQPNGGFVLKME